MQKEQTLNTTITKTIQCNYLISFPKGYEDSDEPFPLVLFLHGAGQRGDDLKLLKFHGPPRMIEQGHDFPAVFLSPQCPIKKIWSIDILITLLDTIVEKYNIDKKRIYLTGLSMGGFGTWALACEYANRFAAIAPICGGGLALLAYRVNKIPIWAFHGDADTDVPHQESIRMVDAVNKAGGKAKLTIYPGVGHDSWTATYNNPDFWAWLFQQHKQ